MTIIVYNSKTGSSEKYAKLLSERTGLACYSVKENYPGDEDIVFFGWLRKFTVVGLSKVDLSKVRAVCVVAVENEDFFPKDNIVDNHGYDAETFYLRGWIVPEKLSFIERFMIRMLAKMVLKKKESRTEQSVIDAMLHGGSFFDESYLDRVESFVKSGMM